MIMQRRMLQTLASGLFTLLFSLVAQANVEVYDFNSPEQRLRFYNLTDELRCPKCQNQTIADSDAPIANDLRDEVHRMIQSGDSDDEIVNFMVNRYGDFVRYTPALTARTWVLWGGPVVLLLLGLFAVIMLVKRSRVIVEAKDSEQPEAGTQASDKRLQRAKNILEERN